MTDNQPAPQYMVAQIDPATWELCVAANGGWRLVNNFNSEADAEAAISTLIARSKFVAAPPKFFDESGNPMAITRL